MTIASREDLQRARLDADREMKKQDVRVLVCAGTGCVASGSEAVYEEFRNQLEGREGISLSFAPHEHTKVAAVCHTGCQGICEIGPLVRIQSGDQVIQYVKVRPSDVSAIIMRTILHGEVIDHLLYHQQAQYVSPDDIPFIAKQTRVVLSN